MKPELQRLFDLIEEAAHNYDSAIHTPPPEVWIESIFVQKRKAEAELNGYRPEDTPAAR